MAPSNVILNATELQLKVWAVLAGDDSPPVLSLGRLCMEKGYTYTWEAGQKPTLRKGSSVFECPTDSFVPMITVGYALPLKEEPQEEQGEEDEKG